MLDRLSAGRLTLGLGLGGDGGREFSAFGDPAQPGERAEILDQGVAALTALWAGDVVSSSGKVKVDGVQIEPGPFQSPRIPDLVRLQGSEQPPGRTGSGLRRHLPHRSGLGSGSSRSSNRFAAFVVPSRGSTLHWRPTRA